MGTILTIKGQVTIPKRVREALQLEPGSPVEFAINAAGEVVVRKPDQPRRRTPRRDRFEAARGKAQVKWTSNQLMALLRD